MSHNFSNQFYVEALMENIPDNIYFKDLQGKFVKVNKSQSEFLGLKTPEEAIGKTDFDFTLADSSKGVFECINYALTSLGLPTVSQQEVCHTIGWSLKDTFLNLTKGENITKYHEFAYLFIKRADEIMTSLTILYDPVPDTIQSLKDFGYALGIVSTKFRHRIESILKDYNLDKVFDFIVGGEDVLRHKPHPEGLLLTMKRLGSSSRNTVYVGDSIIDSKTAELAKVSFIAVLSGVKLNNNFKKYNVYKIIKDISELPRILRN